MQKSRTRRNFLTGAMAASAAGSLALPAVQASAVKTNPVVSGDFPKGAGKLPDGWEALSPNPALAPVFEYGEEGGRSFLAATGNGRRECFGYARKRVQLTGGRTYKLAVWLHFEGFEDLNLHAVHGVFAEGFNNGIVAYTREGRAAVGESRFAGPARDIVAEIRLYFRFSSTAE
jgi:hypothetical protein